MQCPKCGYVLSDLEPACPRCAHAEEQRRADAVRYVAYYAKVDDDAARAALELNRWDAQAAVAALGGTTHAGDAHRGDTPAQATTSSQPTSGSPDRRPTTTWADANLGPGGPYGTWPSLIGISALLGLASLIMGAVGLAQARTPEARVWAGRYVIAALICMCICGPLVLCAVGGGLRGERPQPAHATAPSPTRRSAAAAPPRASTQSAATWTKVASWSGTGAKKTEPFTVGERWMLVYSTRSAQIEGLGRMPGNLIVMSYRPDGAMADMLVNVMGDASDTTYAYGSGTYYLDIIASQPWSVEVRALR